MRMGGKQHADLGEILDRFSLVVSFTNRTKILVRTTLFCPYCKILAEWLILPSGACHSCGKFYRLWALRSKKRVGWQAIRALKSLLSHWWPLGATSAFWVVCRQRLSPGDRVPWNMKVLRKEEKHRKMHNVKSVTVKLWASEQFLEAEGRDVADKRRFEGIRSHTADFFFTHQKSRT
jgi:hypothetical protein